MLHDCETGIIDFILTKSISRFARNTTDCLELVRKLNALGISIYFKKENINTLDAKGEVLITIYLPRNIPPDTGGVPPPGTSMLRKRYA